MRRLRSRGGAGIAVAAVEADAAREAAVGTGTVNGMSTAIQWAVYPARSTDAMIAAGVTDKPDAARSAVEAVLSVAPNAGWGEVVRIVVPGEFPTDDELSEWPPLGEVHVCRRAADDAYAWLPLFPLRNPLPAQNET
jgi:hypothetical protein